MNGTLTEGARVRVTGISEYAGKEGVVESIMEDDGSVYAGVRIGLILWWVVSSELVLLPSGGEL
jgi:hypothetical protein